MNDEPPPFLTYRAIGPARVTHGAGCARTLPGAVGELGARRVVVVTGPTIADATNLLWYVEQLLGPLHAGSYTGVSPHTPEETIEEALDLVQAAEADALVSLGGGSAIDTAKALALACSNGGERPPLPHIAIPTTLSAAEFTYYAGVTDAVARTKRRIADPRLAPVHVLLDPRLTLETPPPLWLSSGIKALDHALESLVGARHHPVTDALALQAARELFAVLPLCANDPTDVEPRGRAQLAAWMSLFSPATARGGLSHALSHQLGAHGVPHGVTSCVMLPPVLRFLEPQIPARQVEIAHALGLSSSLADGVADLVVTLGLPRRLRDTALPRAELRPIAAKALEEARAASPVPVTDEDTLHAVLEGAW